MASERPRAGGGSRGRIRGLRRQRVSARQVLSGLMRSAGSRRGLSLVGIGASALVWAMLVLVWGRQRDLLAPERVARETIVARVDFEIDDGAATMAARSEARLRAPRVYVAQVGVLDELMASLENLPRTVQAVASPAELDERIARQFEIDAARLDALRGLVVGGEVDRAWNVSLARLRTLLEGTPLLDSGTWQQERQALGEFIELRVGDRASRVSESVAVNLGDAQALRERAELLARRAPFAGELLGVVVSRLTVDPVPTFRFDEIESARLATEAAAGVGVVRRPIERGSVLVREGEKVTASLLDIVRSERRAYRTIAGAPVGLWVGSLAIAGGLLAGVGAYIWGFCPRIRRSASRVGWLAALALAMLSVGVIASGTNPTFIMLVGVAPTMLLTVVLALAYDQRTALAIGSAHGLLVGIALRLEPAQVLLIIAGAALSAAMLPEVRERRTLVRMGVWSGVGMGLLTGMISFAVKSSPADEGDAIAFLLRETAVDTALAGFSGLLVAGLAMFMLPWLERAFGITTGLTLMELRDPKQPLLRELQRRAPGTYNHSLHVASIAEDAADAIGARSLLTYVGALYHDIGKMNKPEYFVENQSGGVSKHEKLSPAMSLLVIVGHVKDGVELAKEFGVPKPLHHFIEAHHGTTLVEYFYHRARTEAGEGSTPTEFEYRYPGPRPQTKECAILMLSDAVESATRSLKEPTPSRIDALVREIATKRLLDGQFDECALTLRELNTIVETISKSVSAIYHGRIAYPKGERKPEQARQRA